MPKRKTFKKSTKTPSTKKFKLQPYHHIQNDVIALLVAAVIGFVLLYLLLNGFNKKFNQKALNYNQSDNQYSQVTQEKRFAIYQQNSSGQNGFAVIKEYGEKITVEINVNQGSSTPQPAHIHIGSCPNPGAVLYPLNDVVNGKSITTLDGINIAQLQNKGKTAINVHKNSQTLAVYTACADIPQN